MGKVEIVVGIPEPKVGLAEGILVVAAVGVDRRMELVGVGMAAAVLL